VIRRRIHAALPVLALLTVFAMGVVGNTARAQEPPDRTLPAQLSAPTRAALERIIDSARVAGLPVDPLYSKVREGVFRSADEPRVIAAVQRLGRDLGDARAALGDSVGDEEIVAGGNALRAGIKPAELSRLRDARGRTERHPLTVALVVLADLATRGVPPAMAAASVNELVARNVSDGSLLSFRQSVERDLVGGRSPASALDARTKSMVDEVERRKP
jgi:hypothetical protein